MSNLRFLGPFALGALSMLATVIAIERTSPGAVNRVRALVVPEAASAGAVDADVRIVATPAPVALPPTAGPPPPGRIEPSVVPASTPLAALRLLIPVEGVTATTLVDSYRDPRGGGLHNAIDIMAPRGTPVVASADGVVMKLFNSVRGGTALYQLAPDRRTIYYYAHLDRYASSIAEGQALRRGDVLGYVGNTGSAGPGNYHLHFEVTTTSDPAKYWGGVSQNPYPLLR